MFAQPVAVRISLSARYKSSIGNRIREFVNSEFANSKPIIRHHKPSEWQSPYTLLRDARHSCDELGLKFSPPDAVLRHGLPRSLGVRLGRPLYGIIPPTAAQMPMYPTQAIRRRAAVVRAASPRTPALAGEPYTNCLCLAPGVHAIP